MTHVAFYHHLYLFRLQLGWDEPLMSFSSCFEAWHAILPNNQLEKVDHRPHGVLPVSWINAVDFMVRAHLPSSFQQLHEMFPSFFIFQYFSDNRERKTSFCHTLQILQSGSSLMVFLKSTETFLKDGRDFTSLVGQAMMRESLG